MRPSMRMPPHAAGRFGARPHQRLGHTGALHCHFAIVHRLAFGVDDFQQSAADVAAAALRVSPARPCSACPSDGGAVRSSSAGARPGTSDVVGARWQSRALGASKAGGAVSAAGYCDASCQRAGHGCAALAAQAASAVASSSNSGTRVAAVVWCGEVRSWQAPVNDAVVDSRHTAGACGRGQKT